MINGYLPPGMMGLGLFKSMIYLFWLAEFLFALLVVYWFVSQGFSSKGFASVEDIPPESTAYTGGSLIIWIIFFAVILLGIAIGA